MLIWLDLEMTGLDPESHVIIEIACAVTDSDLSNIYEGPNIVIHHEENVLRASSEWALEHFSASGLFEQSRRSSISMRDAERQVLDFLKNYSEPESTPLCGNSIWVDRVFLLRQMPLLHDFLHYRNIDVSTIKELVKRWYPELPVFQKTSVHSARMDILESIEELRYYRKHVFV